jgi:pimeloyl-ACP methyl ester carboxylesterase
MWDDQVAEFGGRFRVLRYDLRGWGGTPCPPGRYSHPDDLRQLLDSQGMERAHMLGCSFGARVALDFALTHPERVDRLILTTPAVGGFDFEDPMTLQAEEAVKAAHHRGDLARAAELMVRLWFDGLWRSPEEVDPAPRGRLLAMVRHLFELPEDEGVRADLDPPAIERLEGIEAPTLVLTGALDVPDIQRAARILSGSIPGARQVEIEGVAHFPNMEKPEEFNRLVLAFLEA